MNSHKNVSFVNIAAVDVPDTVDSTTPTVSEFFSNSQSYQQSLVTLQSLSKLQSSSSSSSVLGSSNLSSTTALSAIQTDEMSSMVTSTRDSIKLVPIHYDITEKNKQLLNQAVPGTFLYNQINNSELVADYRIIAKNLPANSVKVFLNSGDCRPPTIEKN